MIRRKIRNNCRHQTSDLNHYKLLNVNDNEENKRGNKRLEIIAAGQTSD